MIIKDLKCTFYPNPTPTKEREYLMFLETTNAYSSGTLGIICAFISYLAISIQQDFLKLLLKYKPPITMLSLDLMYMSVMPSNQNELLQLYNKILPITDLQSLAAFLLVESPEQWKSREKAIKSVLSIFANIKSLDTDAPYFKLVAKRFQQTITVHNELGIETEKYPYAFKGGVQFEIPLVKCKKSVGVMISKEMYLAINPEVTIQYCRMCNRAPSVICSRLHMASILQEQELLVFAIQCKKNESLGLVLGEILTIPKTEYKKTLYSKSIVSHIQSKTKYSKSDIHKMSLAPELVEQLFAKYRESEAVKRLQRCMEMSKTFTKQLACIEEFKFPLVD